MDQPIQEASEIHVTMENSIRNSGVTLSWA